EFGQMFRRFGSRVTIVERGPRLISREDPDISDAIADIMREDGLELLFDAKPVRMESEHGANSFRVVVQTGSGEHSIEGSDFLAATGRAPNTEALYLDATGVEINDRGYLKVNDRLETNVSGIYGIGDVTGAPQFAHISYDHFRILKANLLDGGSA